MIDQQSTIQLFNLIISGISTTVIFSITNSHVKQKGKINEELYRQIDIYEKWFKENEQFFTGQNNWCSELPLLLLLSVTPPFFQ
jgi:hypothetical protein